MEEAMIEIMKVANEGGMVADGKQVFVEIFEMRRVAHQVGFNNGEFDKLVYDAVKRGVIGLNLGNPGDLSEKEKRECYKDQQDDLYITANEM